MEKVKLTKEQAKAVDELLSVYEGGIAKAEVYRPKLIMEKAKRIWHSPEFIDAYTISDDDFIKALYFGYEVDRTPEERVLDYYEESMRKFGDSTLGSQREDYHDGETDGIVNTLNLLGITIEGVTD